MEQSYKCITSGGCLKWWAVPGSEGECGSYLRTSHPLSVSSLFSGVHPSLLVDYRVDRRVSKTKCVLLIQ